MQPGMPTARLDGATRSDSLHNLFGFGGGAALIAAPVFGLGLSGTNRAYRRATSALATATIVSGAAALGGLTGSRKGTWQRAFQAFSHTWQFIAACRLVALDRQR